jgi:hypothetical protein
VKSHFFDLTPYVQISGGLCIIYQFFQFATFEWCIYSNTIHVWVIWPLSFWCLEAYVEDRTVLSLTRMATDFICHLLPCCRTWVRHELRDKNSACKFPCFHG